ncbi:MAG TPA: 23S rRNA (pseudouridine(1915)-N(3))-methyltransferase RlmH [Steroidobacteraceae bacterium]|jgi:23S rRNA (pseudouridine1915-N3)-methyltransferase|nr:23S rRNA (pseudouridine(1915)-N(3))-methyltransferase RlmH [Steroidobacteraceae bacterium]
MNLRLIAVGTRMPEWVQQGYNEYAKRLAQDYRLELVEIPLGQRGSSDSSKAVEKEGERMQSNLAAMGNPFVVALQVGGKSLSTEQLAQFLQTRARDGRHVAFCIGGPDGIAPSVDAKADLRWSLSSLTLPHALVRVIVAEALYRAVSVIKQHPYHRA